MFHREGPPPPANSENFKAPASPAATEALGEGIGHKRSAEPEQENTKKTKRGKMDISYINEPATTPTVDTPINPVPEEERTNSVRPNSENPNIVYNFFGSVTIYNAPVVAPTPINPISGLNLLAEAANTIESLHQNTEASEEQFENQPWSGSDTESETEPEVESIMENPTPKSIQPRGKSGKSIYPEVQAIINKHKETPLPEDPEERKAEIKRRKQEKKNATFRAIWKNKRKEILEARKQNNENTIYKEPGKSMYPEVQALMDEFAKTPLPEDPEERKAEIERRRKEKRNATSKASKKRKKEML